MRKPAVDYRSFRLQNIGNPQYSHLKLLLFWPVFLTLFFLTERLIPAENCTPVHMWLDDFIPFCEYFLIPYVFWYFLIAISLGYFLLFNVASFRKLQTYIAVIQLLAMTVIITFPTRQDLRPTHFPRENLLTQGVRLLYCLDTNTGVCPSVHVAISIGIASVWLREKSAHPMWKTFVVIAAILICLSTMFLKQHSAVDFFAALPVCLVAEILVRHLPEKMP